MIWKTRFMKLLVKMLLFALLTSAPAMASTDANGMPQTNSTAVIQWPDWLTGKGIKAFWRHLINIFLADCQDMPKTLVWEEDAMDVPVEHLTDGSLPK